MPKKTSSYSKPSNPNEHVRIHIKRGFGGGLWKVVGEHADGDGLLVEAVATNDHFKKGERVGVFRAHTTTERAEDVKVLAKAE